MAGIFQPTLETEIQFERAIEQPSTLGTFAKLGSGLLDGFARGQRDSAPSSADKRAAADAENLKNYTSELDDIHQTRDQIAPDKYNADINRLNGKYYGMGVDVGSTPYSNARKLITGLGDDQLVLTENERVINEFNSTAEGQGEIAFAVAQLNSIGEEVTNDNIATILREREETKAAVSTLKIESEASLMQAKPVIKALTDQFEKDTQNAYFALRDQGIPVTPAMIQGRYVDFLTVRSEIESRIPANAPLAQKEDILKDLARMDDFFVQLGMERKDGEIVLRTQSELALEGKMATFLSVLGESDNAADMALSLKMMDPNYNLMPADYDLMQARLSGLGADTDITPDWIQEADIVVTNDLIKTYNNLIEFETSGGRAAMDLETKQREGALSLVNPDEQAKWSGLTNAQGWTATKAFSQATKGFSKEAILSGQMTDGFYNTVAGLALSFETIDIMEEPISFAGVRTEVSSKLPDLIKTAEAVDPAKGAAIRALMYRSLVTQRFQYDTRIASDEKALDIILNTETGTYNLNSNTSDPRKLKVIQIINDKYGGSIEKIFDDNFRALDWSDFPEYQAESLKRAGQTAQSYAQALFNQYLPNEDAYRELLDLRNSAVYLNNLATQIEPKASKDARELSAEVKAAEDTTPEPAPEAAPAETTTGEVAQDGKTRETAWRITDQTSFDNVPVGDLYLNPGDGLVYTKKAGQGGR
jgi:hypothetical protein